MPGPPPCKPGIRRLVTPSQCQRFRTGGYYGQVVQHRTKICMYIQERIPAEGLSADEYDFLRSIGVDFVSIDRLPTDTLGPDADEAAWVEYFNKMSAQVEAHGLRLYSVFVGTEACVWQGDDAAGREAEIGRWCTILRALGEVGIGWCGYNFKWGNQRTESAVGRGGSTYSTFVLDELEAHGENMSPVPLTEEEMWSNIKHLLDAVIPVAEASSVRLALHPEDPPVLQPLGGVGHVTSTLDQYEKIFSITGADSSSSGMLFCQGCVTEMSPESRNGGTVIDAITRMASQDKIGWVHFRNVAGTEMNFREVYIDEGQVDMHEAMCAYREAGFHGPYMMDHTPNVAGAAGKEGMAFAVGYIRALIQVVYADELRRSVEDPPTYANPRL